VLRKLKSARSKPKPKPELKSKPRQKKSKKIVGYKLYEEGSNMGIFEYECNICGKTVIHVSRSNHILDSKHTEVIYKKFFKPIK